LVWNPTCLAAHAYFVGLMAGFVLGLWLVTDFLLFFIYFDILILKIKNNIILIVNHIQVLRKLKIIYLSFYQQAS
jgi:hypothetical protein